MTPITKKAKLYKYDSPGCLDTESQLVKEHLFSLYLNDNCVHEFICLNSDLKELVCGWLFSEDKISSIDDVKEFVFSDNLNRVDVYTHSSSKKILRIENNSFNYKKEWIFDLANEFNKDLKIHKSTSGTHISLLSVDGKIIWKTEDIGRHNVINKVVGYILLNKINASKSILFTSGRVSSDIVELVALANIPVLVTKSIATLQSIEKASKFNIDLICKAWPDSFEIYK